MSSRFSGKSHSRKSRSLTLDLSALDAEYNERKKEGGVASRTLKSGSRSVHSVASKVSKYAKTIKSNVSNKVKDLFRSKEKIVEEPIFQGCIKYDFFDFKMRSVHAELFEEKLVIPNRTKSVFRKRHPIPFSFDHDCLVSLIDEKGLVNAVRNSPYLDPLVGNKGLKQAILNKIMEKKSLYYYETNMFVLCKIERKRITFFGADTDKLRNEWVKQLSKVINEKRKEEVVVEEEEKRLNTREIYKLIGLD